MNRVPGSCGCESGGAGALRHAFLSDTPMAQRAAAAGVAPPPTMGGVLPTFTWPSTVRAKKDELSPSFESTNEAVKACLSLAPADRAAWTLFYGAWTRFRDRDEAWFGSASEYDEALSYGRELAKWQEILRQKCEIPGPPPPQEPEIPETSLSAVKWVAGAVGLVAVALTVRTVLR